jgi:hypothetical protein
LRAEKLDLWHNSGKMIERIQVEEGFLDGLDLTIARGLNVLFGPNASGTRPHKTNKAIESLAARKGNS